MNQSLKTRLVGAAVLLIAAGLLWPLLFDFDEDMLPEPLVLDIPDTAREVARVKNTEEFSQLEAFDRADSTKALPRNPDAKTTLPSTPLTPEPAVQLKVNSQPADKRVAAPPEKDKPALDERGIPVAYVVQVATFGSWSNADRLRNNLIEGKFKAYTRPETSGQPGPYRVLVGPLLTYNDAQDTKKLIQKNFKITDSFIRRFGHN